MPVVLVSPPTIPDSLFALAKSQVGVEDVTSEDALLKAALAGAVTFLEGPTGWLRRAILPQTLRYEARSFHDCAGGWTEILLPIPPVVTIVDVEYDDPAGAVIALDPAAYRVSGGWLVLNSGYSWPSIRTGPAAVRITYSAGGGPIPDNFISALMLVTADLYTNRESGGTGSVSFEYKMPSTVEALLWGLRCWDE